jgi:hypothetical protein
MVLGWWRLLISRPVSTASSKLLFQTLKVSGFSQLDHNLALGPLDLASLNSVDGGVAEFGESLRSNDCEPTGSSDGVVFDRPLLLQHLFANVDDERLSAVSPDANDLRRGCGGACHLFFLPSLNSSPLTNVITQTSRFLLNSFPSTNWLMLRQQWFRDAISVPIEPQNSCASILHRLSNFILSVMEPNLEYDPMAP